MLTPQRTITKNLLTSALLLLILFGFESLASAQSPDATGSVALSRFLGMIQTMLIYGVFYSLLALGFALIFGAARVINLYHGTFYMLGAYFFATFSKPANFRLPGVAFWAIQIVIIIVLIYHIAKTRKTANSPPKDFFKQISRPAALLIILEVALLLLYFRAHMPSVYHFNLFVGIAISMTLIGLLAIFIYKYIIDPLKDQAIAVMIITLALAFFSAKLLEAIYGNSAIAVPSFVKTSAVPLLLENTIDSKRLLMFFVGFVLIIGVWILMTKTKIGKGVLAVAQDREAAIMMGVNPGFVFSFTICLSGILAGAAGVFTTPFLGDAHPGIWFVPLIKSFAVVMIGGLGSIFGCILGSFILAFFEKVTKYYISSSLEELVFLMVIIALLLWRPQGLFGKKGSF